MQVRKDLAENTYAEVEGLDENKGHPFNKAAVFWTDKVYMTPCMSYASMEKWNDEYSNYSEKFQLRYPGWVLSQSKRVMPGPEVKKVDFGNLWEILKSKDEALLQQNSWIFDDLSDSKYLDNASANTVESMSEQCAYTSFPRCGNSFLRKYLQNITGIATGSDMSLEFNVDLQLQDFKAEEITDSSVWVKKSHDPKPNMNNKIHKSNKILLCVRNPYDCFASLMHFLPSLNQGGQINEKFSDIPEVWNKMVVESTTSYEKFHRVLLE